MTGSSLLWTLIGACSPTTTLAPPPAPVEIPPWPSAVHAPEGACEGKDVPARVEGGTFTLDRTPVPGVPIGTWTAEHGWRERARTAEDGTFAIDLPGPGWVGPSGWAAAPVAWCAGLPPRLHLPPEHEGRSRMVIAGNDFRVTPTCDWTLAAEGLDGEGTLVLWTPEGRGELAATARSGELSLQLPCDVHAFAWVGEGRATAPQGGCDAPVGATCVEPGGGRREVTLRGVRRMSVEAPRGSRVTDGLRVLHVGEGPLPLSVPDGASLRVESAGMVPAVLVGERAVHAVLQGSTLHVNTRVGRNVVVHCAGGTCPPVACAASGAPDEALGCEATEAGADCRCPSDEAVVSGGGREVRVAPGAATASLP